MVQDRNTLTMED